VIRTRFIQLCLSMLWAKDNSSAILTGCLDCMLLVFLNNKPYLFHCNDKATKKILLAWLGRNWKNVMLVDSTLSAESLQRAATDLSTLRTLRLWPSGQELSTPRSSYFYRTSCLQGNLGSRI